MSAVRVYRFSFSQTTWKLKIPTELSLAKIDTVADEMPSIFRSLDIDWMVRENSSNGSGMSSSMDVKVTMEEKSVFENRATWLVPIKS